MFEGRVSMEIIAEQSSRLISQTHNREDSNSCELLVQAYNRIRALEAQNCDLLAQIADIHQQLQSRGLERELRTLKEAVVQRDLKIQNLEKINQKAIIDLVMLVNQYNSLRTLMNQQKCHLTSIPNQLNSPLNFSKINRKQSFDFQFQEEKLQQYCAKQSLKEQQRFALQREHDQWRNDQLFTFDKENLHRSFKSPQVQKTLKNCFSEVQVNKLIKKVHRQEQKSQERQKWKHYHQYCASIQRKYSPNAFSRKQPCQFKKSATLTIKNQASTYKNQRSVINYGQKWGQTATTTGSFFTVPNKLNFY